MSDLTPSPLPWISDAIWGGVVVVLAWLGKVLFERWLAGHRVELEQLRAELTGMDRRLTAELARNQARGQRFDQLQAEALVNLYHAFVEMRVEVWPDRGEPFTQENPKYKAYWTAWWRAGVFLDADADKVFSRVADMVVAARGMTEVGQSRESTQIILGAYTDLFGKLGEEVRHTIRRLIVGEQQHNRDADGSALSDGA
jgi:hypothetical protein